MSRVAQKNSLSIHKAAYDEAICHKWLLSEKKGHDVGKKAVDEWYKLNWILYIRFRRLEHLRGHCHWQEFEIQSFGLLASYSHFDQTLLDGILDRLCEGQENLDIINWAFDCHLNIEEVIDILECFDVNGTRFDPVTP